MSSLEETVEKQAETISQLADLMERNESRHRSLERTIRWMGVSVFILAIMLIVPVNQESLLRIVHATGSGSAESAANEEKATTPIAPTTKQPMKCGQIGNADCDQVKKMVTEVAMNIFGQMIKQLNVGNLESTLIGYSPKYLLLMKNRIDREIKSLEKQQTEEKAGKIKLSPMKKAYIANRLADLKHFKKHGHNMSILDHIANIDYDFDSLGGMKMLLSHMMSDMDNMSNQMTNMSGNMDNMSTQMTNMSGNMDNMSTQMTNMSGNIDNMSGRMDTMAVDMHNMNTMAFDIHNMAATGVPVMGRMNNATSWMPW